MARPAKSVKVKTGAISSAESDARTEIEDKLRVKEPLVAPNELTDEQTKIFEFITNALVSADILSGLDVYAMSNFCIAIDRLRTIETMVNDNPEYMFDTALMSARAKYESTMWRGCNEFCLTPQARAKIGSLAVQAAKQKEDPLLKALMDDD